MPDNAESPGAAPARLAEVGGAFLRLGLISFGGPVAHLGYFRKEFVERRRWLDDQAYADTVALCQFLPGPASSQVAFALGMRRAGLAGALGASLGFMLPSAVAMILFGYGIASLGDVRSAGWLHGLKLAAVAVVALAVWAMGVKLCPDWPRRVLGIAAAAAVLLLPGTLSQVAVIGACAAIGWLAFRGNVSPGEGPARGLSRGHLWAAASLALFAALLAFLPVLARVTQVKPLAVFDSFYRAGSLVFGGGHVVLPLLRSEVVRPGWIGDDAFLAGYGAAQALPGPLFTFAAYLGTVIQGGSHAWTGGLLALFAIFLPGWLLVGGAYPFWHLIRGMAWARAALRGADAAVVGLLLAALYRPVCTEGIRDARDVAAALAAAFLLGKLRTPPWAVVLLMAALGQWALR
ncbi:MAG TPA: chromate efflux transporter [Opitutaceae bacterium]|nr:chromate efflux transporter [Opitutaceae bacterium]